MKRHSRFLAIVLTLCMVLSMLPLTALAASLTFTDKYGTWEYVEEVDGTITIIGFTAARKNIAVPAMIDGKPVIRLGDGLFKNNEEITMVVIPMGVREIGAEAFSGCTYLERVELPDTMNAIGDGAFSNCAVLGDLYIPSSVTELGQGVFADSPQIHVTCEIDSAAAEYLQENRTEVPHFTLIEVEQTPAAPAGAEGVAKGELVTYEFGRTINGKREYTLVLADSMPDLNLNSYIIKDSAGYDTLDSRAWEVMDNRFKLVSLQQYDGSETRDITPDRDTAGVGLYLNRVENGIVEVRYSLYVVGEQSDLEQISSVEFSDANQLIGYSFHRFDWQDSQVKKDSGSLAAYSVNDSTHKEYYADGQLVGISDHSQSTVHQAAVDGSCVEIYIHKQSDRDSAQAELKWEDKDVIVKDGEGNQITAGVSSMTEKDGTLHTNGYYHEYSQNQLMETESIRVTYDKDGVDEVHESAVKPVDDGVYQRTSISVDKEDSRDSSYESYLTETDKNGNVIKEESYQVDTHTEQENLLDYREETVRAENVDEFYEHRFSQFPNEPDEHTYDVSKRSIDVVGRSDSTETRTNLEDEEDVTVSQWSSSQERLSDHTYIGQTGKYVGWDWDWYYYADIDPQTQQTTYQNVSYSVTEYRYSYDDETKTDSWTRTEVWVYAQDEKSIEDFKKTFTKDNLENYTLHSTEYVFDASVEGGVDNWRLLEPEEAGVEAGEAEQKPTASEIALGETSVTVGETEIQQEERKQELEELEAELLEKPMQDDSEKYFEEVLETVPDGEELLAEVENALETNTVPESNTTEEWEHNCYGDVSVGDLTEEDAGSPATTLDDNADTQAEPAAVTVSTESDAAPQDAEEAA